MTNNLSRSEFMKSGIVAALGLLVPKFIADIGGYVAGIGRGSPHIIDNKGLTVQISPKTWEVRTQEEFDYAYDNVRQGDTIFLHPNTYQVNNPLNSNVDDLGFYISRGVELFGDYII